MTTVSTAVTTAEAARKLHVDATRGDVASFERAALAALQAGLPAYSITKVEAEITNKGAAIKFTVTYTPKSLDPNKVKALLK